MNTIYLTDDAQALRTLREARIPIFDLTSQAMPDMRGAEVVVIGKNGTAKKGALALAARGISESRLNYVDFEDGTSVLDLIAKPKHLFWDDARSLAEASDDADFQVYESGFPFLDPNLKWRFPELCIVAGPYGSGKSVLAQILATRFTAMHGDKLGCRALLCSWRTFPSEVRFGVKRHAESLGMYPADLWDRIHYVSRPPSEDRLIAWYVDLVRYYQARFNTRFFVLDPWNEIDHVKDVRQSETDYVRDMMKAFRRLVDELKIILLIVTHVSAKVVRQDGSIEPFRLAQAFGSVNFANKADRGLCVLRSKAIGGDHMVVRFDKSKIERKMGVKGTVALTLNQDEFSLKYDRHATEQVRDVWKG